MTEAATAPEVRAHSSDGSTADPGSPVALIDVDAHLGQLPDAPVNWPDATSLARLQEQLGITASLVTAVSALLHDPMIGNAETLAAAQELPGASACPMIIPPTPGTDSLLTSPAWRAAAAATAAPQLHGWSLSDPALDPIFAAMADRGLPLRISAMQAPLPALEAFAGRHRDIPVLATEIGYRSLRPLAGVLERQPSVHVVLSNFSSHLGLEWLVEHFGSERALFGTGTPWHDPGSATARLRWSALAVDDLTAVAWGNAVRLMPTLAPATAPQVIR